MKAFDIKQLKIPDRIYKNDKGEIVKETQFKSFLYEANALLSFDHPNISKLHHIWLVEEKQVAHLVMDYHEKGKLVNWIGDQHIFAINKSAFGSSEEYFAALPKLVFGVCQALLHSEFSSPSAQLLPQRYQTGQYRSYPRKPADFGRFRNRYKNQRQPRQRPPNFGRHPLLHVTRMS